jgi:hypothetical protein
MPAGGSVVSFNHRSRSYVFALLAVAALFVSVAPTLAEAQRRHRGPVRVVRPVVVIGGHGYYRHWRYDPWYQWGPYGYPPYGYAYGLRDDLTTSLRLQVAPRQTQVFVDGYLAGTVDDFDGVFQRLRLRPGGHTITLFLEGYRTEEQNLYLRPGGDQRIQLTLEPLASGERSQPPTPPREGTDDEVEPAEGIPGRRVAEPNVANDVRQRPAPFGTLSLRVQPATAEVLIDGERWTGSVEQDRVVIQLPEGRHRIEVRQSGLVTYAEDVLIRRDRTLTLNVSLQGQ